MRKFINNPKLMAILSAVLLIINFTTLKINFLPAKLLYFATSGCLVLLLYFILVLIKKHLNLSLMNSIVFINFLFVLLYRCHLLLNEKSSDIIFLLPILYIPFLMLLTAGLGIIFYSKNKVIIKPNIISMVCILTYIVCLLFTFKSYQSYNNFTNYIYDLLETIYYIPIILYFRLYGINKLKKMEVKNGR